MARKSLGTLTLDLIAKVSGFEQGMDKAARKSQKTAKKIEKYSNQIGAALTAGTAAAVTGMAALVTSTADGAREIKNLSTLAGATPQEFQKLTYAAKRYGIEQDKVSDILKDTNDRIGDFIQTGGGPMADFFENIAPKVGVTADEFARLSGPEALQLYVRSLEEAGVSQKDMTFYMEAIASDATALIPLLRDNGQEMKALGDEAERTGNVFSDMEFEQLEAVRRGMDELTGAATGMKNEVVMAAIPAINDLIDLLSDEDTLESAQALGTAVVTAMNKTVQAIDGAIKITRFLAEELAAMTAGAAADDLVRLQDQLETLQSMQENPTERLRFFGKDGIVEFYDEAEIAAEIKKTEQLIGQAKAQLQQKAKEGPSVSLVDEPSVPEWASAGAGPSVSYGGAGATTTDPAVGQADEDLQSRVDSIRQAFETERQEVLRIYGERNEEIAALYEADAISKMEADHLKIQSEERMQERLAEIRQQQLDDERNLQQQKQALILAGTENLFGSMADLTGEFAGEQSALYKTMFAVQKAAAIAQSIVAINTGIAQAAAVPFPANLAAMASVAAATAGIVSNIQEVSITGMAHDGIDSVPKEGTWLLDEGERVLTSPQADSLDAFLARQEAGGSSGTTVNVIEDSSRAGQTETRRGSNGEEEVNVFVADIMGGGRRAQAIQTAFGLRRQGN